MDLELKEQRSLELLRADSHQDLVEQIRALDYPVIIQYIVPNGSRVVAYITRKAAPQPVVEPEEDFVAETTIKKTTRKGK